VGGLALADILLTLDAWEHTQVVLGAGLMGSMINLRVINEYEQATFFTGGHAHGAVFGPRGNIALGSILYCVPHVIEPKDWCPVLVRTAW
jgi:nitric oxide reductase subunit B